MKCSSLDIKGISKYLSFLLRHHPEELGLKMDDAGWVSVEELLKKLNVNRIKKISVDDIRQIVAENDKQRFALEERNHNLYIRANQGHSIKTLNMGYIPVEPPDILYHGTGDKYVESIYQNGILHKGRQYVHLSSTIEMAKRVGERHGKPRIFKVNSQQMFKDGVVFYCSENGVWLTDFVDRKYIELIFA